KNRFDFLVFSEMMWTFSDHFGFLNAGPGIQYKTGKVILGLSAGAAIPLPRQKDFNSVDYANRSFLDSYNFGKELQDVHYNNTHNSNFDNSNVYYESYTMNPGTMLAARVDILLEPRWTLGMVIG